MKVGVLDTGDVGRSLGHGLIERGHEVRKLARRYPLARFCRPRVAKKTPAAITIAAATIANVAGQRLDGCVATAESPSEAVAEGDFTGMVGVAVGDASAIVSTCGRGVASGATDPGAVATGGSAVTGSEVEALAVG